MTPRQELYVSACRKLCSAKLSRMAVQDMLLDKADALDEKGQHHLADKIRFYVDFMNRQLTTAQKRINER